MSENNYEEEKIKNYGFVEKGTKGIFSEAIWEYIGKLISTDNPGGKPKKSFSILLVSSDCG